ncbi:MAG: UDP-N-acetylmuramoyl-L-alanine--D-glutamate ligase [Betaproteobacteria bacterium]|nr:UDP-N-acetylmuramoyl-L-alanine--D-glutamate ligase [Betaproteobacteria bacterium]
MKSLRDQSVLVLGLGLSGLAMARWCVRQGARVTVVDTREQAPQRAALQATCPQAQFVSGPFSAELVRGQQAVFKSPGLSPIEVAPVIDAARAIGLHVGNELTLFVAALRELAQQAEPEALEPDGLPESTAAQDPASLTAPQAQEPVTIPVPVPQHPGYRPYVLAITGTNGKTTVTSLTARLIARAGRTVAVAGNIGPTLLDTLTAVLDADERPQVWVLELSSFQLHDVDDFEPDAATVLNLSEDHLDWHGSMQAYANDKARIYGSRGLMVLNRDDPWVMAQRPQAPPKGKSRMAAPRPYQTFGADLPARAGDWGLEQVGGMTWLVRAAPADETVKRRRDEDEAIHIQRLMPAEALRIRGHHNACNALAALSLASVTGCALAPMLHELREYRGEPHRVESIGVIEGVEFFDDSKGTNVGATVAALRGLGAERSVVLILGGQGKGQDFSPLAEPVAAHARAVVLIGRDAPVLQQALASTAVPLPRAADMVDAVRQSLGLAQAGDAVLLSPACASFDMFRDYKHRAEVFCAAVRDLAQEQGVPL